MDFIVTRPTVSIHSPTTAETVIDTPDGFATVCLTAEPIPGSAAYTLAVTAETWSEDEGRGRGFPVPDLRGLAFLLGCVPTEAAVAARLDELIGDVLHARWERQRDASDRA